MATPNSDEFVSGLNSENNVWANRLFVGPDQTELLPEGRRPLTAQWRITEIAAAAGETAIPWNPISFDHIGIEVSDDLTELTLPDGVYAIMTMFKFGLHGAPGTGTGTERGFKSQSYGEFLVAPVVGGYTAFTITEIIDTDNVGVKYWIKAIHDADIGESVEVNGITTIVKL